MYDLMIKNVRILDGTSAPWFRGGVAIKDGRICKVGNLRGCKAKEIIDGEDKYLSPGFIDIHAHSDVTLPSYPQAESRILQGITTEIGGDCGLSVAPVSRDPNKRKQLKDYVGDLPYTWETVGEYLDDLEAKRPSVNFGTAVGHGSLRIYAMGFEDRKPTAEEMEVMKAALRQALEDGAFCMSSGLIYPPGCYSDVEEMAELCKELVPYGAFYETHMRNEGDYVVESLKEAIEVCRRSGAPLQVCHHKIVNKQNWLKSKITIPMIEAAREEGLDVKTDQYPYEASATTMDSNIPQWAFDGGMEALLKRLEDPEIRAKLREEANASHVGRWGDIYVAYAESDKNQKYVGKSIAEIAEIRGVDPADACFDLVYDEKGRCNEVNYGMCEEDIEYIMKQPYVMPGSDGNSVSLDYPGQPHPRWYGTFPRIIAHYCRDRKLFPLETAIFKITGLPASRLGLSDRGLIKEGMWADLVLFDFDTIQDTPTYNDPKRPCQGILRVYVNGQLTAKDGVHTGARCGKVLRKGK